MKEIKFRAWDKKEKKYYYNIGIDSSDSAPRCIDVGEPLKMITFNDVIIEQYTGLNNPDGTKIYEGDLLDDGGFGLIEVFWSESDGCTYVKHIGKNGHLSGDDLCCYTDRLVCGNIHQ